MIVLRAVRGPLVTPPKGGVADQGQSLRKARPAAPLPVLILPAVLDEMPLVLDRPIAANQPHQPARAHLLGRQRVKPSGAFEGPPMVVDPTFEPGHVGLETQQNRLRNVRARVEA